MRSTFRWWRHAGCAPSYSYAWAGCGPSGHAQRGARFETRGHGGPGARAFGVRRPLRFLAWKLELDDEQLGEVARILGDLRTERAQGDVDRERRLGAFADAVAGESFDAGRAAEGAALRVSSAERLRAATLRALEALHGVLTPEQRRTLALLLRSGSVSF